MVDQRISVCKRQIFSHQTWLKFNIKKVNICVCLKFSSYVKLEVVKALLLNLPKQIVP